MKKLTSLLMLTLAMTVMVNAPLKAEENQTTQTEETNKAGEMHRSITKADEMIAAGKEDHVPVGSRTVSLVEHVAIQEERAQRAQEAAEEKNGGEEVSVVDSEDDEDVIAAKVYRTSHNGVYFQPTAVSPDGRSVTLQDGSCWAIASSDAYKTHDWLASDTVLIFPSHSWFSNYQYVLLNQQTGRTCKANLTLGPLYNGVHTHWVVAVDYLTREIVLEDGSYWKIAGGDNKTLNKWLVNDTVMVGINDTWLSSYPNILINVNMLNYVEAECQN